MEKINSNSQKITPFLWFDGNAEEAVQFYTSVFKDSRITTINRYGEGAPMPKGTVMTVEFYIEGQRFVALNGGPQYTFTPAISFVINCNNQDEIDYYWNKLSSGQFEQCGWLQDKFGVSWQVVPADLGELLNKDPERSQKAMQALMQMKKIVIADLEKAYEG